MKEELIIYTLSSTKFAGEVVFKFDTSGLMLGYDITGAKLDEQQKKWLLFDRPRTLEELKQKLTTSKFAKLVRRLFWKENVTFDEFWERYNYKALSSKVKTRKVWDKMKQTDRDRAYNFIEVYDAMIAKEGIAKKYATTYLNDRLWEN